LRFKPSATGTPIGSPLIPELAGPKSTIPASSIFPAVLYASPEGPQSTRASRTASLMTFENAAARDHYLLAHPDMTGRKNSCRFVEKCGWAFDYAE